MTDPVVWVSFTCAIAVLLIFGVLERPGGDFRAKATRKAVGGAGFLVATLVTWAVLGLDVASAGFGLTDPTVAVVGALGCMITMVPVAAYSSTRPGTWAHVPELRAPSFPPARIATLVAAWTVYLIGYEAFFRGVLTHVLVAELGAVRGLGVMTGLYGLAHLTKRPGEAFGTLVVGPIYGWIAIRSGGFWPILVVHVAIACTAELVAAWKNPDIPFGKDA
ncbi:MAG: CPBP family intramembrane metalloprotease [Myxococcales bacterium]|nr:CPBP family intramembrane metalloprotease [Myxococcales bacterium]